MELSFLVCVVSSRDVSFFFLCSVSPHYISLSSMDFLLPYRRRKRREEERIGHIFENNIMQRKGLKVETFIVSFD